MVESSEAEGLEVHGGERIPAAGDAPTDEAVAVPAYEANAQRRPEEMSRGETLATIPDLSFDSWSYRHLSSGTWSRWSFDELNFMVP